MTWPPKPPSPPITHNSYRPPRRATATTTTFTLPVVILLLQLLTLEPPYITASSHGEEEVLRHPLWLVFGGQGQFKLVPPRYSPFLHNYTDLSDKCRYACSAGSHLLPPHGKQGVPARPEAAGGCPPDRRWRAPAVPSATPPRDGLLVTMVSLASPEPYLLRYSRCKECD